MPKPLIIDNGMYVNLAVRLAQETECAYFSAWHSAFPVSREFAPGSGIENLERVDDPITYMLEGNASHVIVPDLYLNDYERLARRMEIPVFGAAEGNRIETDRWFLKQLLDQAGLPVIATHEVSGLDAVRKLLEADPSRYVKVSVFRGDMETKKGRDFLTQYDSLKARLGPLGDQMRFLVEDEIPDALEVGIDTFVLNGAFAAVSIIGVESKDAGYFGTLADTMPALFKPTVVALSDYFARENYNCFFSNEMRVRGDDVYMTDATCRIPSPPGGVMMAACRNLLDVLTKGEQPDYGDARYFCEIVLKSDWVAKNWTKVEFPAEIAERVAFHNYCVIDGATWVIPHDSEYEEFGSALGWGKTPDAAMAMCRESAEAVEATGLRFDPKVLDSAREDLETI